MRWRDCYGLYLHMPNPPREVEVGAWKWWALTRLPVCAALFVLTWWAY